MNSTKAIRLFTFDFYEMSMIVIGFQPRELSPHRILNLMIQICLCRQNWLRGAISRENS